MANGHRIGYVRVSSLDQNTDRQLDGNELDRVFTHKASGKDTKRPQLQAALEYLRDGDTSSYIVSIAWREAPKTCLCRQPVRPESVTHVSGIKRYVCVRNRPLI